MTKNEILKNVENIAINGDTDQTKLNALNLLLSYELASEKEAELEKNERKKMQNLKKE